MEKKKTGIVIALIVVIVLLLSYIGYTSFFKVTNKNETVTVIRKKLILVVRILQQLKMKH